MLIKRSVALNSILKVATLVPILVLVFYSDFVPWLQELLSQHLLGFLIGAISITSYGIYLKRRIFSSYLDLGRSSFVWGLLALSVSILLYLAGSLYLYRNFFHFASLLTLVLSYTVFRFDKRMALQFVLLFAIVGLPFAIPLLASASTQLLSEICVSLLTVGLLACFVRLELSALVPIMVVCALEIASYFAHFADAQVIFWAAIPLALVGLGLPKKFRERFQLKSPPVQDCSHKPSKINEDGFCLLCSRKVASSVHAERPNFVALVVLVAVVALLLLVQFPLLTISGDIPSSSTYAFHSVTTRPYLPTPSGWLINSTNALNIPGEDASLVVYVPFYHPETKNYSVTTALGFGQLSLGRGTGEDMIGWKIVSHSQAALNQYFGYSTVYQAGSLLRVNFAGFSHETFWNGKSFLNYGLGLSITRTFNGVPLTNATAEFARDLNASFSSALARDAYSGSWTHFLQSSTTSLSNLIQPLELVVTGGFIVWAVFKIEASDYDLDSAFTNASGLEGNDWVIFSTLSSAKHLKRTTLQILGLLRRRQSGSKLQTPEETSLSLQKLRKLGLTHLVLSEDGAEVLLMWKVLP